MTSFSSSGKSSGRVWPRLKSVTSWPRASDASTTWRPRKTVPPRIRMCMGSAYWSSLTQEAEWPDLIGHLPFGEGWPEIFFQDAIAKQFMPRVDELFT